MSANVADTPRNPGPSRRAFSDRARSFSALAPFSVGRDIGLDPTTCDGMGGLERDLLSAVVRLMQCAASARGRSKHRGGFFLWSLVGIFHRAGWKCDGCRDIVFHQSSDRAELASTTVVAELDFGSIGTCD